MEGYDFLRMIDEEEEEKERTRLKKQKLEQALNEDLDEESEWSSSEADKTEEKKSSRLRRPEVKSPRDEL